MHTDNKDDGRHIEKYQSRQTTDLPVAAVFEQKFVFGNHEDTLFFGLFCNDELVGVAMPSAESGRGLAISDIGGIDILKSHTTDETLQLLWGTVIQHSIDNEFLPVNGGVSSEDNFITADACKKMGYKLISKRYTVTGGI